MFPGEVEAQEWLLQALAVLRDLAFVTSGLVAAPNETALEFSIMEGLFARGFTSIASIIALDEADFAYALTGSVAFQWASQNLDQGRRLARSARAAPGSFKPVNPAGSVTASRRPSSRRSARSSTCMSCSRRARARRARAGGERGQLRRAVAGAPRRPREPRGEPRQPRDATACGRPRQRVPGVPRRAGRGVGRLGQRRRRRRLRHGAARSTRSLAAPTGDPARAGRALPPRPCGAVRGAARKFDPGEFGRRAVGLFGACPRLQLARAPLRPAAGRLALLPVRAGDHARRGDAPLPARITEFVLGPDPVGFDSAVWRYPLRRDIAPEYLELAYDEYLQLFATPVSTTAPPPAGELGVWQLYGFAKPVSGWINTVLRVSEFLRRTGLSYCEFVELATAGSSPCTSGHGHRNRSPTASRATSKSSRSHSVRGSHPSTH